MCSPASQPFKSEVDAVKAVAGEDNTLLLVSVYNVPDTTAFEGEGTVDPKAVKQQLFHNNALLQAYFPGFFRALAEQRSVLPNRGRVPLDRVDDIVDPDEVDAEWRDVLRPEIQFRVAGGVEAQAQVETLFATHVEGRVQASKSGAASPYVLRFERMAVRTDGGNRV